MNNQIEIDAYKKALDDMERYAKDQWNEAIETAIQTLAKGYLEIPHDFIKAKLESLKKP